MTMPLPFEQQEQESHQAFAAFVVYRDLRSDRSCEAVAQKVAKSSRLIKRWSARHNWVDRARSYDAAMDARARLATEKQAIQQRREMLAAHADEARELRKMAQRLRDEFFRRWNEHKGTLQWIDGSDLIKMVGQLPKIMETAQQLERLAVGEPSTNLEPPKPVALMNDDELSTYIQLLQTSLT